MLFWLFMSWTGLEPVSSFPLADAQVNAEIDALEDLLAVESEFVEVKIYISMATKISRE